MSKYFALLLMMITVLAGSNDSLTAPEAMQFNRGTLSYVLRLNKFLSDSKLMQKSEKLTKKQIIICKQIKDILAGSARASVPIYFLVVGVLFVLITHANNTIDKNNLWKSAVF